MKQKLLLVFMMLTAAFTASAQEIKTYSSCDTNTDESVTISDVTNTANKVLGKVASEQNMVTAEQLNTLLSEINTKLEKLNEIQKRLTYMENQGIYTYPFENDHEYVDLGLSVKWATCNVGASSPEEYGNYFAWGETTGYNEGKTTFDWSTYTLCGGSYKTMTKYCTYSSYGTVDDKTVLESSDDAATANWGGSWRMPTYDEQEELRTGCYWEWTSSYNSTGVAGYLVYKVKSDSDKGVMKSDGSSTTTVGSYTTSDTHIFLPAAGFHINRSVESAGSYGRYWSSSLDSSLSNSAYGFGFDSSNVNEDGFGRYGGPSVRPVCK